ncbi:hypothetical protein CMI48_01065 [Candidatus Pacearchaeota archaeon]|nr:hypothetical protein [Candidatus Pacearchaeota archaeon]
MSFEDLARARDLVDQGDQIGASEIYIELLKKCYEGDHFLAASLLVAECGGRRHAQGVLQKHFQSGKDAYDFVDGIWVDLHITTQNYLQMRDSNDTLYLSVLEEAFSPSSR